MAFVLRERLPQIFHPGRRECDGLLVVGTMDPEAAILWIHLVSQVPQELLVLGEHSAARLMVNAKAGAAMSGGAGDSHRVAPLPR
jgi:hypothetical protein